MQENILLEDAPLEAVNLKAEEAAIKEVVEKYVQTWNLHNMDAWGQLFTEDVEYVNRAGGWWQGNKANVEEHKKIHAELPNHTTYQAIVAKIRLLAPKISIVHAIWTMDGLRRKEGDAVGESKGVLSMVLVKRNGAWLIRAAQNTVADPST